MCSIDLEACSVWIESKVRARKEHVCDCCDGAIKPGEVYVRHFSLFDRDATTEKMCAPCEQMSATFEAEHGQRGTPGSMSELLSQCVTDAWDDDEPNSKKWRAYLDEMQERRKARRAA